MLNQNKQPKSLYILSFTEMWERYGFYTIQALLLLFLLNNFNLDSSKAYMITGTFTAISYISPLIGGYIADKFTGQRLAIFLGIFFPSKISAASVSSSFGSSFLEKVLSKRVYILLGVSSELVIFLLFLEKGAVAKLLKSPRDGASLKFFVKRSL